MSKRGSVWKRFCCLCCGNEPKRQPTRRCCRRNLSAPLAVKIIKSTDLIIIIIKDDDNNNKNNYKRTSTWSVPHEAAPFAHVVDIHRSGSICVLALHFDNKIENQIKEKEKQNHTTIE
jgi:hypothetical protein